MQPLNTNDLTKETHFKSASLQAVILCEEKQWTVPVASYPQVFSETKQHALYLWIHLKPEANAKQCVKVVANLQAHVDAVCPPDLRDENDEVFAGVGFGPEFWYKVSEPSVF